MEYTVGCTSNGKLTGIRARITGDTGAYASVGMKVLERAAGHAAGAYEIPNADIHAMAVYTNNVPCGAMRGFGVNQVTFAVESIIDELCIAGNFDPWKFRYENALADGKTTVTGQILEGGVGVRACLEALKPYYDSPEIKGLACGIKNTGIGNGASDIGTIRIEIGEEGHVVVCHGWTEMGQGANTAAKLFLERLSGIPLDKIEVRVDTSDNTPAGMTTGSRGTSLIGHALVDACSKLNDDLRNQPIQKLAGKTYYGEWICDWTAKPGEGITHYSYGYAAQLAILDDTGKILEIIAAHDAGHILNPLLYEGQIEGSVHMGLGYALSENLITENGYISAKSMRDLGLIPITEMPSVKVLGVEVPDPNGPFGAKGVGEIGLVPTAAAVANAFCRYDGFRRYSLPLEKPKNTLSK